MSKWIAFRSIQILFPLCSSPLSHTSKGITEISLQVQKGIWKILVKTVTIFLLSLIFIVVSYCSLSFLMLLFSLCSWLFWFCLLRSLYISVRTKNLSMRLKGLKEEVKARLFLATIPLAENTAAVEMRKQLIGITGYHVSTAALSCRAMQESNLNHALICACSWESPSSLKALLVPWVMVKLPASDCSADPGGECDEGLGFHTESQFRKCPFPGGSFKE